MAQDCIQSASRRRPGAPLGNQNAFIHGRRSKQSSDLCRARAANMKALAWALRELGMIQDRCRPRPLRPDQARFIDQELLEVVRVAGGYYPELDPATTIG
jgi:hypothetical protein